MSGNWSQSAARRHAPGRRSCNMTGTSQPRRRTGRVRHLHDAGPRQRSQTDASRYHKDSDYKMMTFQKQIAVEMCRLRFYICVYHYSLSPFSASFGQLDPARQALDSADIARNPPVFNNSERIRFRYSVTNTQAQAGFIQFTFAGRSVGNYCILSAGQRHLIRTVRSFRHVHFRNCCSAIFHYARQLYLEGICGIFRRFRICFRHARHTDFFACAEPDLPAGRFAEPDSQTAHISIDRHRRNQVQSHHRQRPHIVPDTAAV